MAILKKFFGINPDERENPPAGLRGTGVEGGKGIFDEYFNQMLFETQADHIIVTEANVKLATNPTGTCYYNSTSTEFQDRNDATVTFLDGDRVVWGGLDAITANIDISTIDDLEHVMFQGVTIALGTYNLDLGKNQRGELDLSGTGTLTVQSSDGLRIKTGGTITVDVQSGDKILNNIVEADNLAIDWQAVDLEVSIPTVSTVDVDAKKIQLVSDDNIIKIKEPLDVTVTMPTDLNAGSQKASTKYEVYVSSNQTGTVGKKLVPILIGTTTSTSSGNLPDTGATFLTDAVLAESVVKNTTDGTETTVSVDASSETTIALTDDIFASGEDYEIHIKPTFDSGHIFYALPATVLNGSGSDFEAIKYEKTEKYAILKDVKATTTSGGSSSAGVFQDRDLNSLETNIDGVVLDTSTGFFKLPPGDYRIYATTPGHQCDRMQGELYDITNSSSFIVGSSGSSAGAGSVTYNSVISGAFTLSEITEFKIRMYAQTSFSIGLGVDASSGNDEVYTIVNIAKVDG